MAKQFAYVFSMQKLVRELLVLYAQSLRRSETDSYWHSPPVTPAWHSPVHAPSSSAFPAGLGRWLSGYVVLHLCTVCLVQLA